MVSTGQLQPLDMAINEPFKHYLKELFSLLSAEKVKYHLDGGLTVENIKVDLHTSVIKCTNSGWLIKNMEWLSGKEGIMLRGCKDVTRILDKLKTCLHCMHSLDLIEICSLWLCLHYNMASIRIEVDFKWTLRMHAQYLQHVACN